MPAQNLVSATLTPDVINKVLSGANQIKTGLGFLLNLQRAEIQGLFKAGNNYAPFVEKAHGVASAHPEILPGVFDLEEFKNDYQLSKDLAMIGDLINELADGIAKTRLAVNSDALMAALDVYAAAKRSVDKVPGLGVVCAEMGQFFKKSKKAAAKA
jgi:hypothetical protein